MTDQKNESEEEESKDELTQAREKAQSNEQESLTPLQAAQKEALYLRAEFENYKRRLLREQDQAIKFANERLISDLSTVADLMDRALLLAEPLKDKSAGTDLEKDVSNFLTGISMTFHELVQVLGRFGVEFFGTAGEKFDPSKHEAISQQPVEEAQAGTVLNVVQKGCMLQGRLLRPARVVVGEKA